MYKDLINAYITIIDNHDKIVIANPEHRQFKEISKQELKQ